MIFLNLTGGLGNQLFQLSTALALSDGEEIQIEWSFGSVRLNSEGQPELASFDLPPHVKFASKRKLFPKFIAKVLGYSQRTNNSSKVNKIYANIILQMAEYILSIYFRKKLSLVCPDNFGYSELKVNSGDIFLNGYFQSFYWANKSTNVMKHLRSNGGFVSEFRKLARTEKPLVIHVRRGDYRNENTFGLLSSEYYKNAIHKLEASLDFQKIWLFSDEPNYAIRLFPENLRSSIRIVDLKDASSAETLEIMSLGSSYIIANSTFSWWGAYLSGAQKVLSPAKWFKGAEDPHMLIPPEWISIPAIFEESF